MSPTFDTCYNCESPRRKIIAPVSSVHEQFRFRYLESNGCMVDTDYWFCSIKCYEEALSQLMPKRYKIGKSPVNDPDYDPEGDYEEFFEYWHVIFYHYLEEAENDLHARIYHEFCNEVSKEAERRIKEQEKQDEQAAKRLEKQQKDQERAAEQQEKKVEKEAKRLAEEEAAQTEQEQWRPRPFEL